jgi:hypothetical protein
MEGWSEIDDAAFAWFVGMYALLNLGQDGAAVLEKMAPFEVILYDTCWMDQRFQDRLQDLKQPTPCPQCKDMGVTNQNKPCPIHGE